MRIVLATAAILLAAAVPTLAADGATEAVLTVTSFDGTGIEILVCKPAGASAASPVPVVLQSHGWGGSRWDDCGSAGGWLAAGWGAVSISQRGFGNSGGEAHVHDPDFEGRDNIAVIDTIAGFDWVLLEGPNDPVLGAIGGSYGGGYQFITALTETAATGSTRLDVLAPEITWYDLPESLAPAGVVRTEWVTALYAVGAKDVHQGIHEAFVFGAASGQWPDGTLPVYDIDGDFHGNSPAAFVEHGLQLDVPVLLGQGLPDNLFNLNQAWKNFELTLTPDARAASIFIGYNGGHTIPSVLPMGSLEAQLGTNTNPCSASYGGFGALTRAFFESVLFGAEHALPTAPYNLATVDGECLHLGSLSANTGYDAGMVATNTGASVPQYVPLASGPITVAGIPELHARLTSAGVEQRVFFGLARGTTVADAVLLENNMMPLRAPLPVLGEDVHVELAGVAAEIREGETLYLVVAPLSDMSAGHASRAPGVVLLEDVTVDVPLA